MSCTQRQFLLRTGSVFGAVACTAAARHALAASTGLHQMAGVPMRRAAALAVPEVPLVNPISLSRFVNPLPIPPPAQPIGLRLHPALPGRRLPCYRIAMRAFHAHLHRDLPPTPMWGYEGISPGPRFEEAEPGEMRMHFHQAFFASAERRDGHRGGWSQGFERLADLLARTQQG
jgi:spore coat protein A